MRTYKPMKPEDSIIKTSVDLALGKDNTTVSLLRFKAKRRHWWWPFRTKKQKQIELLAQHLVNQEDMIHNTMQALTNLYLYGDENYERPTKHS